MEKLSSILPANARVKSVDLSDAKPRRPGAPDFGTPVGTTSPKDRVTLNSAAEAGKDTLTYRNPKDARGAKIADEMAKKFFETRLIKEEMVVPRASSKPEMAMPMATAEVEKQVVETAAPPAATHSSAQDPGLAELVEE